MRFGSLAATLLLGAVAMGCSGRASAPPAQVPGVTTLTSANVDVVPKEKRILPEVNFDDEDDADGTDGPNDLDGSRSSATYALREAK